MTPVHTILSTALDEVLYEGSAKHMPAAFAAKVDELQERNLGIAFAKHCIARIDAFPLPLRSSIMVALASTMLPAESIAGIVRPALDGRMWRPAMKLMDAMKVPRDEWFQSTDGLPEEFQERVLLRRKQRLAMHGQKVEPKSRKSRRRRRRNRS